MKKFISVLSLLALYLLLDSNKILSVFHILSF